MQFGFQYCCFVSIQLFLPRTAQMVPVQFETMKLTKALPRQREGGVTSLHRCPARQNMCTGKLFLSGFEGQGKE